METAYTVRDFMTKDLVAFTPDMNAITAVRILLKTKISGAPVLNSKNEIVGVLSEKDCLNMIFTASYHNDMGNIVSELMSTNVITVDAALSIADVTKKFMETRYRRFPVIDKGKIIGQISRRDVLRAIEKTR